MLEMATFRTNLELAGFFQFLTIWSFGQLCVRYLTKAPKEYQNALKYAGLQGVYLYVIFGAIRSVFALAEAVAGSDPKYQTAGALIQDKVLGFIGPVFTVATVLCVYNMIIIGKMDDVKKRLGSANMKFQGTRALLLLGQIQLQVLSGLVVGSKIYLQIKKAPEPINKLADHFHLSTYRANLLHAALLNFECLLVVVFNRIVWKPRVAYDDDGLSKRLLQA